MPESDATTLSPREQAAVAEYSKKAYLKPLQRQELKRNVEAAEYMLAHQGSLEGVGLAPDYDLAQRNLERDKQMLASGTPPELPVSERNFLFKLQNKLQTMITWDMPTHDQMQRDTAANVDFHMGHMATHKLNIPAWKNIRMTLDRDNDGVNFTNMEILRTNTPPKGDPRRYWRGFENVSWEAETSAELASQIDDESYLKFLEMKLKNWSVATICRELSWDKAHHEAAMTRFRDAAQAAEEAEKEEQWADDLMPVEPIPQHVPPPAADSPPLSKDLPEVRSREWLEDEMAARDLSLSDVERLVGVDRRVLGRYRNGTSAVPEELAQQLTRVFAALDAEMLALSTTKDQ
jgi:hypothetical protein